MVESLHADGACPRIHVDLTCEGIVCPDFVCEQWKEELVIDLDPSYPLNLAFTEEGIEADLSFGGFVTRCTVPFHSIYMVADRDTGRGFVIDENMPDSVANILESTASLWASWQAPQLRLPSITRRSPGLMNCR